jgi:hypothetical protein
MWLQCILGPQAPLCQLCLIYPSLSKLLVTTGPQMFDPAMGDRTGGPPPTISLVPRERTRDTFGAGSSSGPARLTPRSSPGQCASLPLGLTDDPKVAQIVPSAYIGHVTMFTNNKVMTIKELSYFPSMACPSFELQLGEPSELRAYI